MQISDNLNLVIPIRRVDDGSALIQGYHTPISRAVFEANFRTLAAVKAALFANGAKYATDVGPQIAGLLLIDEAKKEAVRCESFDAEGNPDITGATALLAEIRRLTMILGPTQNGWENMPVDVAVGRKIIDEDEWREAEAGICFFTCLLLLSPKHKRAKIFDVLAAPIGGTGTSLTLMEFAASLPISTQGAPMLKVAS